MLYTLKVQTAEMPLTLAHLPLTLKVPTANPVNMGVIVYLIKLLLVTHNAFTVSLKGLIFG